jgi:cellobiose-specific phosphotransferase system component IIC
MKTTLIIATILAILIGILSVISGSMVLLGLRSVDYRVLDWLVVYNVTLGIISILVAYQIGKQYSRSKLMIMTILLLHFLVLVYLYFFNDMVADESIKAMAFRVGIWVAILILVLLNHTKTLSNKIKS